MIPITKEQAEIDGAEYVVSLLHQVCKKYKLENYYFDCGIERFMSRNEILWNGQNKNSDSLLMYLLFPEILEQTVLHHKIVCKSMHLVLIDSGDYKIEYILELLVEHLNFLKILTNRTEYFKEYVELVYAEYNLIIEVIGLPLVEEIKGNLIIDLNNKEFSIYKYFQKDAVVIQMGCNSNKLRYLFSHRKDLQIVYDVFIKAANEHVINNVRLSKILSCECWLWKGFLEGKLHLHYQEMLPFLKKYKIVVNNLKKTKD